MTIKVNQIEVSHLAEICSLRCQSLQSLSILLRGNLDTESMLNSLEPLLSRQAFPHLTCLRLHFCQNSDALAEAIAQSPLIKQLRVLDLSFGNLTDKGASALFHIQPTYRLHTLDMTHTDVSAKMATRFPQSHGYNVLSGNNDRYFSSYE